MAYAAKILADSISPQGHRLVTFEVTYPLIVHAEFIRHRDLSYSVQSNRAMPTKKVIEAVMEDPFVPERWPINQKGMQAQEYYEEDSKEANRSREVWLQSRDNAVQSVRQMTQGDWIFGSLHVHKQIANRLLSPFQWVTKVVSGTRFSNFFALRDHEDAQPELAKIARMMRELYEANEPRLIRPAHIPLMGSDWHLPYVTDDDFRTVFNTLIGTDKGGCQEQAEILKKLSVARCARVSYLKHPTDDKPATPATIEEDIALCEKLAASGHWSPFEHVATPHEIPHQDGNFYGWHQMRKDYPNECR